MIPILYEERSFLVCLKPPGLLSQAGPGEDLLQGARSSPSTVWTGAWAG